MCVLCIQYPVCEFKRGVSVSVFVWTPCLISPRPRARLERLYAWADRLAAEPLLPNKRALQPELSRALAKEKFTAFVPLDKVSSSALNLDSAISSSCGAINHSPHRRALNVI